MEVSFTSVTTSLVMLGMTRLNTCGRMMWMKVCAFV